MAEDGRAKVDKFDEHEFSFWKIQIEDLLYQKKLHEPLSKNILFVMSQEDWNLLDRQTL